MTRKRKSLLTLILTGALALSLCTGCGNSEQGLIEPVDSLPEISSEPEPEPEPEPVGNQNPLTGLYDLNDSMVGKRPVSFMINNHHKSWPQKGISQADIIYELPVEGGFTRLMAVFADYTKADVFGSNRSVRHDFVELSLPFDTIFVHWGGSDAGYSALRKYGVDDIDGMAYGDRYFYTDRSLNRSIEHCRFMKKEGLTEAIENIGISTDGDTPNAYQFAEEENGVLGSEPATSATVKISGDVTTGFAYDSATQTYTKTEFNDQTLDGNTGEPVHIKNVFILYDKIVLMSDGLHKDLSLTSGTGYYLTNGTKIPIQWSKGDANSPMSYTKSTGETLTVNPGNSWVVFVPNSMADQTTIS
jgi:hypothetical protein